MLSTRDVFICARRRLLLQNLFLPWRRRGTSLLLAGLGSGLQPDFFWEAGFEVSALESNQDRLEKVRADSSPRVDFFLSRPEHQPFDDSSYDYVVLAHLGLKKRALLAEAVRVASRGVIVLEWNRFSFAVFQQGQDLPLVSPWNLLWLARQECPGCRACMKSTLPLPPFLWPGRHEGHEGRERQAEQTGDGETRRKKRRCLGCAHDVVLPLPIGALMGLRIDLESPVLTPLGAVTEALHAASRPKPEVAWGQRLTGQTEKTRATVSEFPPLSAPGKD